MVETYTHDGNWWGVTGYLHYLTNQITIFPQLFNMKNSEYQLDWLKSMNDYELVEHGGHIIRFQITENQEIPQSSWETKFYGYDFVEWAEMRYNRYTIYDESIEVGDNTEEGNDVNVDSKINISMVEAFTESPRTFQLNCWTERIYSGGGYRLHVAYSQSSNSIDISFKGVSEPNGGTAEPFPAAAYINFGSLNEGTYRLNLYNGNVKYTGELIVTSDSYTVNFDANSVFGFTHSSLNRIPEHTIWGHVGGQTALIRSFLTELTGLGAVKRLYNPGYYREFEIDQTGNIVQLNDTSQQTFIFHYSGDIANIDRLVGKYARDYKDQWGAIVYTDKGAQFLSWTY
jgi:hypothetical protein